jgi:hypothetical protein
MRPEVSRALEAVVMKGLERDRDRRWQSLDDLREALVGLLPARQHPARPRALIGAYALDRIALAFLTVPAELARMWAMGVTEGKVGVFELHWAALLVLLAYFTVGEGVFGATPGKWLLGLRVSRLGQTGPPGVRRAFVRTGVFHALLMSVFQLPEKLVEWLGPAAGGAIGGAVFLMASVTLLAQLRKKWGYRGLHDWVTGCHVTQRPLPARKLRLPVRRPTPLEVLLPPPPDPLPETLGTYAVRGRVAVDASGEQVWVGEDRVLARSMLICLKPATGAAPPPDVYRPTRLRRLGSGTLTWAGQSFEWTAFVAPLGGPLLEAVNPARPLPWADARFILDQLVEEFRTAEADGSTPARLTLDQVWVEPNGRLQLLECPISATPGPVRSFTPLGLVREVASLALEGRPRSTAGPVRAPLPAHAVPLLDRLFTDGGYPTLADLQRDLADTHVHRPEVTPAVRAAHLGIQAAALAAPLGVLFVFTFLLAPLLAQGAKKHAEYADAALAALADPEKKAKLAARPELVEPLKHPRLVERLEGLRDRKQEEAESRRSLLFAPQRFVLEHVLEQIEAHAPPDPEREAGFPVQVREAVQWAGAPDGTPRAKSSSPWRSDAATVLVVLLVVPAGMILVAAFVRGGVSMLLAGIAIVRSDGRRAGRRQCGVRAAVVWLPVAALLLGAAALQAWFPQRVYLAAGLWLLAVALLPVYVVIALRFPTRPPQDRVTGTYLVPA